MAHDLTETDDPVPEKKRLRGNGLDTTPTRKGRALVYVPALSSGHPAQLKASADGPVHAPEARLAEALGLAAAIDLEIVGSGIIPLRMIRPATLIGSGKVKEIAEIVEREHLELVVVDYPLTPVQQRNLEKELKAKVLDRTGLILEIFGRRARTAEGKLQVELAALTYAKSRLVRAWTHLERQRGGAGFLGGPGETQKELDKRMIQDAIDSIKIDLEKVKRTRELHREGRRQVPYPVVALVGYTNAGKSTLFNTLTGAGVLAKDLLFATLDPTMREVKLESGRKLILADTVGFISELPTMLIAAFRATLEEVLAADVILHVRDIADAESDAQRADVLKVLKGLGIATEGPDCPILEVWNKADLLDEERRAFLANQATREVLGAHVVSSVTADGIPALLAAVDERLARRDRTIRLEIDPAEGRFIAWLHQNAEVLDQGMTDKGQMAVSVRLDETRRGRLDAQLTRWARSKARRVPASQGAPWRTVVAAYTCKWLAFHRNGAPEAAHPTPLRPPWPRSTARPSRRGSTSLGVLPRPASLASMNAKRRVNLALVPRRAASGSISRWRARLAITKMRSPNSPSILALSVPSAISVSSSATSSRILARTGPLSGQSKPTRAALLCNLTARVRPGRPTGTSASTPAACCPLPAAPFSAALAFSQKSLATPAERAASSPNTWG